VNSRRAPHLDDQHVDDPRVRHMTVPVEHLSHLISALTRSDVQLERVNWHTHTHTHTHTG